MNKKWIVMDSVMNKQRKVAVKRMINKALAAPAEGKIKWWHGLLALAAVTIVGVWQSGKKPHTRKLYNKKNEQVPWAPPAWVFGPAWTINNMALMWGLVKILNNKSLPHRATLLTLQGGIWAIYLTFGYVYFKKRSTILAEAWTQTDALLATASFAVAWKGNKNIAISYLPLLLWTWFASSVSAYQVLKNEDPLFNTKALID